MASRDKTCPLTFSQKLFLVKQIKDNPVVHRKPSDYNAVIERKKKWEEITNNFNVNFPLSSKQGWGEYKNFVFEYE